MPPLELVADWVFAGTIRASLLSLVVLALQYFLRKHLEPRWRNALWLPVLAVLLAPASTQSRWSVSSLIHRSNFPGTGLLPASLAQLPAAPRTASRLERPPARSGTAQKVSLRTRIWATGMVLLGLSGLVLFRLRLRQFLQSAQPVPAGLGERIASMAREMGLRTPPRVCITSGIRSPAVCGLWQPTLLLQPSFLNDVDTDEARLILRHELAHIRRGDLLSHALLCLLLAIHWFNPVLWLAFIRIRLDREAACDADVLRDSPPATRAAYGHALLRMGTGPDALRLGFVGLIQRGAALRSRLELIACPPTTPNPMKTLLLLVSLSLTFLGVTRAAEQKTNGPSIHIDAAFHQIPEKSQLPESLDFLNLSGATPGQPRLVGFFSPEQLAMVEAELKKTPGLDTLASPRLIARSGERAKIEIMREVPLRKTGGQTRVGVALSVTPTLQKLPAGTSPAIDLDLEPLIRSLDESVSPSRIEEKSVNLTVTIGDNQSLLLDLGIRRQDVKRTETSGPKTTTSTRAESTRLLVALTARTADSTGTTAAAVPSLQNKLDSLILPRVDFRDATLVDAVRFLREKSRELDAASAPDQRGVNIVLKTDGQKADQIKLTMSLQNVPLRAALQYVASLAGLEYEVLPFAVLLRDKSPEQAEASPLKVASDEIALVNGTHRAKGNVLAQTASGTFQSTAIEFTPTSAPQPSKTKGGSILLPVLDFREASLEDALEFIRQQSRKLDPAGVGAQILIKGSPRPAPLTLSLRNIPVSEALRYVAELSNLRLSTDGQVFILSAPNP